MTNIKAIDLKIYNSNQKIVNSIKELISTDYENLFIGVFIIGSIENNEITNYSDFDGLLIVKNEMRDSNQLKLFLKESLNIILKYDPLQHHGWFIIYENELQQYSDSKLPFIVIKNSKCIFKDSSVEKIKFIICEHEYINNFTVTCNNLSKAIMNKNKPSNLYQLKGMLSQIMLLPSLYYSTIHNQGVLKKDSFDLVRKEFSNDEWKPISIASRLRKKWNYELNYFQNFVMKKNSVLFRYLTKTIVSPRIPNNYQVLVNDDFYFNLDLLINKMRKEVSILRKTL